MKTSFRTFGYWFLLIVFFCISHTASAFYNPETGRWLSRDPIGEDGGINLSSFANNDPADDWDLMGLATQSQMQKQCDSIAKSSCDRARRRVETAKVRYYSGGTTTGYQYVVWREWVCEWLCGNCTEEERKRRQNEKERICNRPRKCTPETVDSCDAIILCLMRNNECARARKNVIDCYVEADERHREHIVRDPRAAQKTCLEKFYDMRCHYWYSVSRHPVTDDVIITRRLK
jgi:hypothetical protein